jgi:23S rRNA (cytosine1962-C5)-methyltransferase
LRSIQLGGGKVPRNPRLFNKRIRRAEKGIRPGELVAVRDGEGRFIARAFYSPDSVIAARVVDRDENGPPLDQAWWSARLREAYHLRTKVLRIPDFSDAFRVVHAEGDGLSGLIIDKFRGTAVVEVGCRGVFNHMDEIETACREVMDVGTVVVRADEAVERREKFRANDVRGKRAVTEIKEHGITYEVDARGGHKTGFFCDQREARLLVHQLARGRSVLDCCSYTGGFALNAARGDAARVTAVDLDEWAVVQVAENAQRNNLDVTAEHADAFDYLRTNPKADIVVLDPPKWAKDRKGLATARRKNVDLNALGFRAVNAGGLLFTFSCTGLVSAQEFEQQIREAARKSGRDARVLRRTLQPPDHPIAMECPETEYLHGILLQVA